MVYRRKQGFFFKKSVSLKDPQTWIPWESFLEPLSLIVLLFYFFFFKLLSHNRLLLYLKCKFLRNIFAIKIGLLKTFFVEVHYCCCLQIYQISYFQGIKCACVYCVRPKPFFPWYPKSWIFRFMVAQSADINTSVF